MTISVAKFVAVPAANAAGTAISGTTGQADSIIAGDFANLLLGQLAGEQWASDSATTGNTDDKLAAEGTDGALSPDSAQLFAALGLPVPATADYSTRTGADRAGALAGDARDPLASRIATLSGAATRPSADGLPTAASGQPVDISRGAFSEALSNVPGQESNPTAVTGEAGNAAKLAGAGKPGIEVSGSGPDNTNMQAPLPTPAPTTLLAATPASQPALTDNSLHLTTPVKDAAWPAELAQKVVWMTRQELQSAQITLNPPQLGPIEIALDVRNDQASAAFVSGSAEVREAIEAALPRLREMLAGIGVELGQTNVSHESFREASEQNSRSRQAETGSGSTAGDRDSVTVAASAGSGVRPRTGNGLVDTFA